MMRLGLWRVVRNRAWRKIKGRGRINRRSITVDVGGVSAHTSNTSSICRAMDGKSRKIAAI
jgi:hypothetical protein